MLRAAATVRTAQKTPICTARRPLFLPQSTPPCFCTAKKPPFSPRCSSYSSYRLMADVFLCGLASPAAARSDVGACDSQPCPAAGGRQLGRRQGGGHGTDRGVVQRAYRADRRRLTAKIQAPEAGYLPFALSPLGLPRLALDPPMRSEPKHIPQSPEVGLFTRILDHSARGNESESPKP